MKWTRMRIFWAAAFAAGAMAATAGAVRERDSTPAHQAPSGPADPLVVHEWGTFTSFSGGDGVQLDFRPFIEQDLPPFVKTPASQFSELLAKGNRYARQRMETPVLYFYTEVPRDVRVRVDFPDGLVTEWYPPAADYNMVGWRNPTAAQQLNDGFIDWGLVRLTPQHLFYSVKVRGDVSEDGEPTAIPASLPTVDAGNHYGAARETDSAIVETLDGYNASSFEKFLFYRGLGDFAAPLLLSAKGEGEFEIHNASDDATGALFLLNVDGDALRFVQRDALAGRSRTTLALPAEPANRDALKQALVDALVASGLYRKEARAMVKTWDASWFSEPGDRVLYIVPRPFVDRMLPLAIDPLPDETARVFVGRLETLTPERTSRIAAAIAAGDEARAALEAEVAALGRFAEPALELIARESRDEALRQRISALIEDLKAPQAEAQQLSDAK